MSVEREVSVDWAGGWECARAIVTVMTTSSPAQPVVRADGSGRWAVTLAATVVSTYALDLVATAGGVLLALSGVFGDLAGGWLLTIVVVSYLIWGLGLRTALRANHALLEQTAVSTSLLSKLAWQVARRTAAGKAARRWASTAGYVSWELAKEIPYYIAAAGAVLIGESIGVDDVLIFLTGANLTAALYEYGIGRGTEVWLARHRFSSFETDWDPGRYLAEYYSEVQADEQHTIRFMVEALRDTPTGQTVLIFGTGPTLHHAFPVAGRAAEIHLADYLERNLDEIRRWLRRDPGAHDWRPFVRYTLQCEGIDSPTPEQVEQREERTRTTVTSMLTADARRRPPLDSEYDAVVSAYCADSATADHATWYAMLRNIVGLVRPGGMFLTAALRSCRSYVVGGKRFPCAGIDELDIGAALEGWFRSITVQTQEVPEHAPQGYGGIVLAAGAGRLDPLPPGRVSDPPAIHGPVRGPARSPRRRPTSRGAPASKENSHDHRTVGCPRRRPRVPGQ